MDMPNGDGDGRGGTPDVRRLGDLGAEIAETDPEALRELVEEAEALAASARAKSAALARGTEEVLAQVILISDRDDFVLTAVWSSLILIGDGRRDA